MIAKQITCSAPDCSAEPTAKGFCAKHYMRLRRHGDPNKALKRGPKRDVGSITGIVQSLFRDQGSRTQARYIRAMTIDRKLVGILGGDSYIVEAIRLAARPNGSVNFSKLLRIMETRAAMLISELPDR
jgi:hypothetical protein